MTGPRRYLLPIVLLLLPRTAEAQVGRLEVQDELRQILSLERSGRIADARTALDGLLERAPTEPGAILAAERIYRRQGELERLVPAIERAIELDPLAVVLRQVQLRVLGDLGRWDELRAAGAGWLQAAPQSVEAYREFAGALRRAGDLEGAERVMLAGLPVVAKTVELRSDLADLYVQLGRWSEAANQWLALLQESPGLGWQLIKYKLEALGDAAVHVAGAIVDRWDGEGRFAKLAAIAAVYAQRPDEARRAAELAIAELDPGESRAFIDQFAQVAGRREQPALAAWAFRKVLRESGESTDWNLVRQVVSNELSAGDTAAAREVLEDVLSRVAEGTPEHRWAAATRIHLESAADGTDRAAAALADYARLYVNDAELPALALAVAEAGLRGGAVDAAQKALDSVAGLEGRADLRGRFAVTRGYLAVQAADYEEARSQLEIAAATLSGAARGDALRLLGFLRGGSRDELRAVAAAHLLVLRDEWLPAFDRLMRGLERAAPSEARPALLLWAGELAIKGRSVAQAAVVLRLISQRYPDAAEAPVALLNLADAYTAAGRSADAIIVLEELILKYPESALTPIGRRQLAELRDEVPRS
ncbi:MAG: tetratricopeptide repeat protein [Gemmatimonadota bacterium]|nr:MAG: tetratricopeptide repeat protein [Gemmatimonadota bacterium]